MRPSGDPPEMMFGMTRAAFERLSPEQQTAVIRAEYAGDERQMNAALGALREGTGTLRAWFEGDQRNDLRRLELNAQTQQAQIEANRDTEIAYINAHATNPALPPQHTPPPQTTLTTTPPATTPAASSVAVPGWGIALGGLALLGLVYAVTRPMPNPDPPTRRTSGGGCARCEGRHTYYNRATKKFARCPCAGGR